MDTTAPSLETRGVMQRVGAFVFTDIRAGKTGMWLFVPVGVVIGYLVLPPLYFILSSSLTPAMEEETTGLTLANYFRIFESASRFSELIWNSMVFSVGSAAWALVFGTVLAWLAERSNAPFRSIAYIAAFDAVDVK